MKKQVLKVILCGAIALTMFNSCDKDSNSTPSPTPSPTPTLSDASVIYKYDVPNPIVSGAGSYTNHLKDLFVFTVSYTDANGVLQNETFTPPFNKSLSIPGSKRPVDIIFKVTAKLNTTLVDTNATYNFCRIATFSVVANDKSAGSGTGVRVESKGVKGKDLLKNSTVMEGMYSYTKEFLKF